MTKEIKICHQKLLRDKNLERDLVAFNISKEEMKSLTPTDFTFRLMVSDGEKKLAKEFIKENEYLGTTGPNSPLHYGAFYKGKLCGVIMFSLPNSFSKLLGDDTQPLERLISRGACSSFTPVGLASHFLMWCLKDMVKTTPFRVFIGYSDPMASEIGTIYQACNFYYLGNDFGTSYMYRDPWKPTRLIADRLFRHRTAYKNYAKELGIIWKKDWTNDKETRIIWDNVPDDIEARLRKYGKEKLAKAEKVYVPPKHKYAYVLGANKRETRELRKKFESLNKTYEYPKNRGEY